MGTARKQTEPHEFYCDGCGALQRMSGYAVAQLAMGYVLTFTHRKEDGGCGKTTRLEP